MKLWKWSVATPSENTYHGSFAVNPIIDYVPGRFRENREKSDPHHEIQSSPATCQAAAGEYLEYHEKSGSHEIPLSSVQVAKLTARYVLGGS